MVNVLFICSRNQWRSPTAETIWRKLQGVSVRSAGTSPRAKRTVTAKDIDWADMIFVMERKHQQQLQAKFPNAMRYKSLEVLDIPDDYRYMDPDLVDIFQDQAALFQSRDL